ncbi:hypothetical protein [Iodobacter fluviatilis]|uniref:Uncharacterized protein n=1 Tax=Iodobacter fluviatilis TaxID=537 RepID=A0A377SYK5_9NEIS|nr:hypothetical protein [Iodobacter fluviatilis]TCU81379.1 hypothetical protein EV682_12217 [Iodobacter fluviatilis]STR46047.1 Uncharacterised protein [Iodobacter fluviatilis]
MFSWRWFFVVVIVLGAWHQCQHRAQKPVHQANGVLVQADPLQSMLDRGEVWQKDNYTIKALADFAIEARVLSKEMYSSGREADLSPVDLALGWGPMSDSEVLSELNISQSNRFYFYRWEDQPPRPPAEIASHSANMHMIPADAQIEKILKAVRPGQIIRLHGKLVEVSAPDGWRWQSSLTRDDTGAGACELFRVESAEIL